MLKIKKGDTVKVITGKDKGKEGKVIAVKAGKVTVDQLREIAEYKMPDLNANTVEAAMRIVAGTARNMGIVVEGMED